MKRSISNTISASFYGGCLELERQQRIGILDGEMSKGERRVEISILRLLKRKGMSYQTFTFFLHLKYYDPRLVQVLEPLTVRRLCHDI